jgi:hypothetical protein
MFSTAEPLKNDICINLLGLSHESVWGTQEDKAKATHLRWEDMPTRVLVNIEEKQNLSLGDSQYKTGLMSGRDVMEYWGTEIFRKANPSSHANALRNMLVNANTAYMLIDDVRFKNEIEVIKELGGHCVRLTLMSEEAEKNSHESNTALDGKEDLFDLVIDNQSISMQETFGQLMDFLVQIGWFVVKE